MSNKDPLRNPKDPLNKSGPEVEKELFRRFSQVANGFPTDAAISAAANILINAIRQNTSTWPEAERAFNEFFGRSKQVLKDHYDSITGRKKGIFPYNQVILPPFHNDSEKF